MAKVFFKIKIKIQLVPTAKDNVRLLYIYKKQKEL